MKRFSVLSVLAMSVFLMLLVTNSASASVCSVTITPEVLDNVLRPGGKTAVFLTITNSSAENADEVRLQFSAGPHLTADTDSVILGALASGSSQQTSLNITVGSSATATISYLTIKATCYSDSTSKTTNANIPITIKTVPILQIDNVKFVQPDNGDNLTSIGPGNIVRLEFDLVNHGDGSAKDIEISLNQSNLFAVSGSGENFVNEIKPDNSVELSFVLTIDPSVSAGTHSIPVSLAYLDEIRNENYSTTEYIGLTISGEYNFIVTLHSQEASTPGTLTSATVKIINAGDQKARFLTVNVLSSDPLIDITPQTVYIGNLNSDDYDTQKFSFKTQEVAPGTYPLRLEIYYKDMYGMGYTEQHSVNVRLYSADELPGGGVSPSVIAVVGFVVILVGYFMFKRLRPKKK